MKRFNRLIRKIHRRFVWQAFAIYLVIAFIAFSVSQHIAEARDLPAWFVDLAIALLIVGLPIVLTTACVQEGVPVLGRPDHTSRSDVRDGAAGDDTPSQSVGAAHRVFTWRNAIIGGVAAFTLWALVAAGWLLLADKLVDDSHSRPTRETPADTGR